MHTCVCWRAMLLVLSKNAAAPVSDPPKVHYFWRIQHAPIGIFEESQQHSWGGMLPGAECHTSIQVEHIVCQVLILVMHQTYLVTLASLSCETIFFYATLKMWIALTVLKPWVLYLFLPKVVKIWQYQICFEFMEYIVIRYK